MSAYLIFTRDKTFDEHELAILERSPGDPIRTRGQDSDALYQGTTFSLATKGQLSARLQPLLDTSCTIRQKHRG
jgi:hypothetical protein